MAGMRRNDRRTRENVARAMRDLALLFAKDEDDPPMKLKPVRKCETPTCSTFTGARYCSRCRRAMAGERLTTAERIAERRSAMAAKDELMDEPTSRGRA